MKIIASSIAQVAETFLHPGYISANPRAVDPYAYNPSEEAYEVGEALRLTNESLASAGGLGESATAAATTASSGSLPLLLAGALCLLGVLATAYIHHEKLLSALTRSGWRAFAPVGASALAVFIFATCGQELEPLPETIPWEGMELREYENPELATRVLLHGLIAPAIVNVGQPIRTLANIQNEVALPTSELTEGEEYALQTYGIDGWGRELVLTDLSGSYRVASAGADGEIDTNDDIQIDVSQTSDSEFDYSREAFFLRQNEGELHVFFHRWNGDFFIYNDRPKAEGLTGSDVYDLWTEDELSDSQLELARAAYDQIEQEVDHEPLILQLSGEGY